MAPSHPYWRDWSHGVAAINMLAVSLTDDTAKRQ